MTYHVPVMRDECVEALKIREDGIYVDATFGGGGHSKAIFEKLNSNGRLIAFDQDEDAVVNAINDKRFVLVRQNFRFLKQNLKFLKAIPVSGILADLGVSSHQFDTAQRGFSHRFNSSLDMRMNASAGKTAANIINEYSREQLQQIFSEYGEVRNAKTLAQSIVDYRQNQPIESTDDLKKILNQSVNEKNRIQYQAQVFQALRIEVNDELNALKQLLVQAAEVLEPGGRLVVLTYHSLEDRLVKHFMNKGNFEGTDVRDLYGNLKGQVLRPVMKKPLTPTSGELVINSRSASAKLRVAEKL